MRIDYTLSGGMNCFAGLTRFEECYVFLDKLKLGSYLYDCEIEEHISNCVVHEYIHLFIKQNNIKTKEVFEEYWINKVIGIETKSLTFFDRLQFWCLNAIQRI